MHSNTPPLENEALTQKADQCVRCGFCLPHCPTFALTRTESHSPRGRIVLIQGLVDEKLPLTANAQEALETCLSCYRCESVCPADVEYGDLIESARQRFAKTSLGFLRLLKYPRFIPVMQWGGWLLRPLIRGLNRVLPEKIKRHRLGRLLRLGQNISRPRSFKTYYPPIGGGHSPSLEVALFLGCVTRFSLGPLFEKTIHLLQDLGYGVHIATNQGCCGAVFAHSGHLNDAERCQKHQKTALAPYQRMSLLTFASGCERDLKAYWPVTQDIIAFLAQVWTSQPISNSRLPQTVVLHTPCTQTPGIIERFLREKMPHVTVHCLPLGCCGAAGLQMLTEGSQADALGQKILSAINWSEISAVLTTNIGCQLHLHSLVRAYHPHIPVLHALEFVLDNEKASKALDKDGF